ncbi:MAG: hypothetical protein N4A49_09070 [Marinifilaceae bacterium]|jgi:hypothetical protein|nr:hypothetical protein [Marinifilaceae bacterium]
MNQFKISEEEFREISKNTLHIIILIVVIIIPLFTLFSFELFILKHSTEIINSFAISFPLILVTIFIGINKAFNSQKIIFQSYTLLIDKSGIRRKQDNTPDIYIKFSDIKSIQKNKKGRLIIKTSKFYNTIIIPHQIKEINKIEKLILENCNCKLTNQCCLKEKLLLPFIILIMCLMTNLILNENRIVILISSLLLSSIILTVFYRIQKNNMIDQSEKKRSFFQLIIVIFILSLSIYKLLT